MVDYERLLELLNWEVEHQYNRWVVSLLAVVELHEPWITTSNMLCTECAISDIEVAWPCKTIQAVADQLEVSK